MKIEDNNTHQKSYCVLHIIGTFVLLRIVPTLERIEEIIGFESVGEALEYLDSKGINDPISIKFAPAKRANIYGD